MASHQNRKESPLRQAPLRNAGESGSERLWGHLLDEAAPWLSVCVVLVLVAVLEWLIWLTNFRPHPIWLTLVAAALIAFFYFRKLPEIREQVRQERLGVEGEKAVGEMLDELKADGYHVIHDIVEDGYNIDHVLIGPTGVYVIETKTRSKKPGRGKVSVTYDGRHVLVDGHAPDRDPLKQVQALADRVRDILRERTGMSPPIRPVVLFPGRWVDPQPKGVAIWVLNEKALPKFVCEEPVRVNPADVRTLVAALESHVRTKEREAR